MEMVEDHLTQHRGSIKNFKISLLKTLSRTVRKLLMTVLL